MKPPTASFIDPKTGRRFRNYSAPLPGIGKPADQVTAEEFADAVRGDPIAARNYFDQVGWPEGYRYCRDSRPYALTTGHQGVCRSIQIEREGLL